jgi:hypothetical protein
LESEGISVEDDKIVKFEELFWDPKKELNSLTPRSPLLEERA